MTIFLEYVAFLKMNELSIDDGYNFDENDDENDDSLEEENDDEDYQVTSYKTMKFESEEMKKLLKLEEPFNDDSNKNSVNYDPGHMLPFWMLENEDWKNTHAKSKDNKISEILQTPQLSRTQEQVSVLIHWLMSVWKTAESMGFKRCGGMTKVFLFQTYEPQESIIVEGERGLTFYIIISGVAAVHKSGIGVVAELTKGQSFGEIALTQGKDIRSATVKAKTRVEVLSLHKTDYDHFVKDILVMHLESCLITK